MWRDVPDDIQRRILRIRACNRLQGAWRARAARKRAASSRNAPAQYHRPDDPLFHPDWVANPRNSALRRGWIDRLKELEFLESTT